MNILSDKLETKCSYNLYNKMISLQNEELHTKGTSLFLFIMVCFRGWKIICLLGRPINCRPSQGPLKDSEHADDGERKCSRERLEQKGIACGAGVAIHHGRDEKHSVCIEALEGRQAFVSLSISDSAADLLPTTFQDHRGQG